jgi:hypothetical protein
VRWRTKFRDIMNVRSSLSDLARTASRTSQDDELLLLFIVATKTENGEEEEDLLLLNCKRTK